MVITALGIYCQILIIWCLCHIITYSFQSLLIIGSYCACNHIFITCLWHLSLAAKHLLKWHGAQLSKFHCTITNLYTVYIAFQLFSPLYSILSLMTFCVSCKTHLFSKYISGFCITLMLTTIRFIFLRFNIWVLQFVIIMKRKQRFSLSSSFHFFFGEDYHTLKFLVQQMEYKISYR